VHSGGQEDRIQPISWYFVNRLILTTIVVVQMGTLVLELGPFSRKKQC
jgi:hypothetical protein